MLSQIESFEKMKLVKLTILLALVVQTLQQEPSTSCVQETSIYTSGVVFYPGSYRAQRLKCTFSNIVAFEQMSQALVAKSMAVANVIAINFNRSNLASFPDRAFATYSNLRSIDASRVSLTDISSNVFSGLKSLDSLVLSFNNLTALSSKVFSNMKLKLLDLSHNQFSTIDESAFLGSEIDKVDLSFNKIKATKFINGFKFFNYMQMSDNDIEKLDSIDVGSGGWGAQREIYMLPQYPTISIQNNKISSFECSSSIKITLIDFTNNPTLSDVKLNKCEIVRLDVSDCGSLKSIKLTDSLSEFTARNVKFEQIDFGEKYSLESLTLVNNSLNGDVIASISKLENLTYLELNYNYIGPLNASTFAKLKKLYTLKLKATNISNISFGTFSHQNLVKVFDISDNNLENFDLNMIYTMNSLTSLDISGNSLSELINIDSAHLTFTILEKIDLTNNKWTCTYLMRLIKIMKTYRVVLTHSAVEEHRSNIQGVYCVHVEGDDSIVPLTPEISNFTEFREKLNEVIGGLAKVRDSVAALGKRVDGQANAAAFVASATPVSGEFQVKNSFILEFSLIIVCVCFTVFMALQIYAVFKRNFLSRPRPMRGISEHTLAMDADDY